MAVYNKSGQIVATAGGSSNGVTSPIFAENHLIAHKGGTAGTANTIANFQTAITNGYKILEADVRFTSDSVPVLSHDATVSGYTIANYTYDALVALVPTLARLDDFLILCKKNNVVAELDFTKEYNSSQTTICYNTVKNCGMIGRTMFTVYEATARTLIGMDSDVIICVSGVASTSGVDGIADIIAGARLCVCSTTYSSVTQSLVE